MKASVIVGWKEKKKGKDWKGIEERVYGSISQEELEIIAQRSGTVDVYRRERTKRYFVFHLLVCAVGSLVE